MVRRREYYRRGSQSTVDRQVSKSGQEHTLNRENAQVQNKEGTQWQGKESNEGKNGYSRENAAKQNYSVQSFSPRYNRIKETETVEDIKEDIARIEKEIQLELKEIRSLKLGL